MEFKENIFIFDTLSKFIGFFIILFTLLIFIYSLGYITKKRKSFYFWFFLTALTSLGVVFFNHIFLLLIFWGFLGITLFKLINLYSEDEAALIAKKTFIIVGGTDSLLLLGLLIYFSLTSSLFIKDHPLPIKDFLSFFSFILIVSACFAKAGCFPFHTWLPDTAKYAPLPVVAYLPACIDKLLGIYLLARVIKDTFILNNLACAVLLILGALTIVGAVMMALIQHNIKRLLGYHAVSQVGYMILGLGCNSPVGIAAGLFHMLNNAIYKSCLFLGAGNVEKRAESCEMKDLGGLASFMPVTFFTMMIASFSISGIPPFNGFISKWMIYQGLIEFFNSNSSLAMKIIILLALVSALIGSSLTLASFLKLLSVIFMGKVKRRVKEVSWILYISPLILAGFCIALGFFSFPLALKFIEKFSGKLLLKGLWNPNLASGLILLGILIGYLFFKISAKKMRISSSYIGGEIIEEEARVEDFYTNIRDLPSLKNIYNKAERNEFDIYEQAKNFTFLFIKFLSYLHNGVLPTYLVWSLLGMLGLFFVFLR